MVTLTAVAMASATVARADARQAPSSRSSCRTVTFPVTLPDSTPATLSGEYCASIVGSRVLQFLVHGAGYNHTYFDWPQEPDTYSYVRRAVAAGYAVLNIDRLGAGDSSRPVSTEVNTPSTVATLHQVITAVRGGALGQPYSLIEYLGHSFGSYYGIALNHTYPKDVDAFLLTGTGATQSALGFAPCPANIHANTLPRFANLDDGYLASVPSSRACHLYYLPDADPAVISYDADTQDTVTLSEFTSRPPTLTPWMGEITAPTLIIDGNHDVHYCFSDNYDCSSTRSFASAITPNFNPNTCLALALEESGHDLQLHTTNALTDALMLAWSNATIPPFTPNSMTSTGRAGPGCVLHGPIPTPGITF